MRQNSDIFYAIRAALIEAGTLTGEQVDEIIAACITARALEKERLRRIEWKAREPSAASFVCQGYQ